MATPAPVGTAVGFPAHFGQHIRNVSSNAQGDNVVVSPAAGNALVAVVIGLSSFNPFDLVHGSSSNQAYQQSLNDFQLTPVVTDTSAASVATITNTALTTNVVTFTAANNFQIGDLVKIAGLTLGAPLNGQTLTVASASATQFTAPFTHANIVSGADAGTATKTTGGNDWLNAAGKVNMANNGSDYTASLGNFTLSSKWSLDGYYPSIFMAYALDVAAGTYKVNVNTCYQNATSNATANPPLWVAGKPYFDGGVDIVVLEFSGVVLAAATDGSMGGLSAANPAVTPSFTPTTNGDMILTAGLMKSGNAFSTSAPSGTTGTIMLAQGKNASTQAHWGIQFQLQTTAAAITPGFSNPLGYEMAVAAVALKHS